VILTKNLFIHDFHLISILIQVSQRSSSPTLQDLLRSSPNHKSRSSILSLTFNFDVIVRVRMIVVSSMPLLRSFQSGVRVNFQQIRIVGQTRISSFYALSLTREYRLKNNTLSKKWIKLLIFSRVRRFSVVESD
jgi:hypothetical protein